MRNILFIMHHKVQLGLMNVMSFKSIYLQTRRLIGRRQPWYLELCCNKQKNKNKKFIVWNLKFNISENGFHAEGVDREPPPRILHYTHWGHRWCSVSKIFTINWSGHCFFKSGIYYSDFEYFTNIFRCLMALLEAPGDLFKLLLLRYLICCH